MSGQGRRVPHITQSCIPCRRKKIRCIPATGVGGDAVVLPCKSCLSQGLDCSWDPAVDSRRSNYRKALDAKITSLQSELQHQKLQYDHLVHQCNLQPGLAPPTMAPLSIEVSQLSTMLHNRLVLDHHGHHQYDSVYQGAPTPRNPQSALANTTSPSVPLNNTIGCTIAWYRFLPMETVPLSEEEHLELLDLFFNCFAFWGLSCIRDLFQRDMQAALSSTKNCTLSHYSPMLHNAILAVATGYSGNPWLKNMDTRMAFAKKAEKYLSDEIRNPTLSGVQAMLHLAIFYAGAGMHIAGMVLFSMCTSMTQARLGVYASELMETKITEQEKHDRDWLSWVIFLQDKVGALFLGRDILIPKPRIVRIPELLGESSSSKSDLFREQVKLFLIATDLFNIVHQYCKAPTTSGDIMELFDAVESWGKNLPSSIQLPDQLTFACPRETIMLHLTFHWTILTLYYPFYQAPRTPSLGNDWNKKAVTSCDLAADQIVHLFESYDNLRQVPLVAVCVAFSAGAVFVFQIKRLESDPVQKQAAADKLTKCMSFMDQMALTWDCASKSGKILERLYSQPSEASSQPSSLGGSAPIMPQLIDYQIYEYFARPFSPTPALAIMPESTPTNSGLFDPHDELMKHNLSNARDVSDYLPAQDPPFSTGLEFSTPPLPPESSVPPHGSTLHPEARQSHSFPVNGSGGASGRIIRSSVNNPACSPPSAVSDGCSADTLPMELDRREEEGR